MFAYCYSIGNSLAINHYIDSFLSCCIVHINSILLLFYLSMTNFQIDICVGLLFITGIYGFISGAFIVSAAVFAMSAIFSNIHLAGRMQD